MLVNHFMPELSISLLVHVCDDHPEILDFIMYLFFHQLPNETLKAARLTGATIRTLVEYLTPMRLRRVRQVGRSLLGLDENLTNAMNVAIAAGYKLRWSRDPILDGPVSKKLKVLAAVKTGVPGTAQQATLQHQQQQQTDAGPAVLSAVPMPSGSTADTGMSGYILRPDYIESRACVIRLLRS